MEESNGLVRVMPDIKYNIQNLLPEPQDIDEEPDSFDLEDSKNI